MSEKNIIKFEIVTPEKIVLKEQILQVTVPTRNGEITVLPNHIPLVASLQPGVIEIKKEDGTPVVISVSGGFIEVLKDKIVLLADTAERAEEIEVDRAEEARKRAEEAKKEVVNKDAIRFADLSARMEKELARTKAVKRWKKLKNVQ